jgi:hypothetical protein
MIRHVRFSVLAVLLAVFITVVLTGKRSSADPAPSFVSGVLAVGPSEQYALTVLQGPLVITDLSLLGGAFVAFLNTSGRACPTDSNPDVTVGNIFSGAAPAPGPLLYGAFNGNAAITGARIFIPGGVQACAYALGFYPPVGVAWSGFIPQ